MKNLIIILLVLLLVGCTQSPAEIPTATSTLEPAPTISSTATPTITPTPDPYANLNYFQIETWTQEMSQIYNGLATRVVAESGNALETQYNQENLELHNGLAYGMVNYLESKGISTYSNWNESNFSDYDQFVNLYLDFRTQINSDPSVEKISPVDPWFDEQILTNPSNYVLAYNGNNGIVHGGLDYQNVTDENTLIANYSSIAEYSSISSIQDLMKLIRSGAASYAYEIPFSGKKITIERNPMTDKFYGQMIDIVKLPSYQNNDVVIMHLMIIDENNQSRLYTCVVNLNLIKTSLNTLIVNGNNEIITIDQLEKQRGLSTDGTYLIPSTGSDIPSTPGRKEYGIDDLLTFINRQVVLTPSNIILDDKNPDDYSKNLWVGQIFFDGMESFGVIQDAGPSQVIPG